MKVSISSLDAFVIFVVHAISTLNPTRNVARQGMPKFTFSKGTMAHRIGSRRKLQRECAITFSDFLILLGIIVF